MNQDGERKGALGALALFGALTLFGMFAALTAVEDYGRARASLAWPAVDGVILSANGDKVRYAWFDGSANHIGERVRFRAAALRSSGAAYQPGSAVSVRVSPENGAVAVLEPGGSAALFALAFAGGALMVFIGLAGLIRLTMLIDGLRPAAAPASSNRYAPAE